MEVYELDFAANDYAGLLVADLDDLDRLEGFDGTPIARRWKPWRPLRMCWQTEGGTRPVPDVCGLAGGGFAFSDRALGVLGDLLEESGELLPLEVIGGADCELLNVTRLVDALDEERSEVLYLPSGGVMEVDRYELIGERLEGEAIFKLPQLRVYDPFVTDGFRQRVEEAGLTGLQWKEPVWSGPVSSRSGG